MEFVHARTDCVRSVPEPSDRLCRRDGGRVHREFYRLSFNNLTHCASQLSKRKVRVFDYNYWDSRGGASRKQAFEHHAVRDIASYSHSLDRIFKGFESVEFPSRRTTACDCHPVSVVPEKLHPYGRPRMAVSDESPSSRPARARHHVLVQSQCRAINLGLHRLYPASDMGRLACAARFPVADLVLSPAPAVCDLVVDSVEKSASCRTDNMVPDSDDLHSRSRRTAIHARSLGSLYHARVVGIAGSAGPSPVDDKIYTPDSARDPDRDFHVRPDEGDQPSRSDNHR